MQLRITVLVFLLTLSTSSALRSPRHDLEHTRGGGSLRRIQHCQHTTDHDDDSRVEWAFARPGSPEAQRLKETMYSFSKECATDDPTEGGQPQVLPASSIMPRSVQQLSDEEVTSLLKSRHYLSSASSLAFTTMT